MTWGNPQALWLGALGVPVVLLHFYRGRIRKLDVPSLLFWDAVVREEEQRSAFRRLRHHLSLLLVLASLGVLAVALARPSWPGSNPAAADVVLLIDTSAEMEIREADGFTRAQHAVRRTRDLAADVSRRSRLWLADAGGILGEAPRNRKGLTQAIRRMMAERRQVLPLPPILGEIQAALPGCSLYVITARRVADPGPGVRIIPVGTPRPNRLLHSPERTPGAVRAVAANRSDRPVELILVASNRGRTFLETPLALGPRESKPVTVDLDGRKWPEERFDQGALIELAISPSDDFPDDDAVHFVVPPANPGIVVVSPGAPDAHLWTALRLMESRVVSIRPSQIRETRERYGESPVYVFDRVDPPVDLDGGFMMVDCGPLGETIDRPRILDWERRLPVHELVGYADVNLRRARRVGGNPLIRSDRGAIAAWGRRMGRVWLQFGFGFSVADGDFALKPSFWILLRNAVRWLGDEGRRAFPYEVSTGESIQGEADIPSGVLEATVVRVSRGETTAVPAVRNGGTVRFRSDRAGLVKVTAGGRSEWMAARSAGSPDLELLPEEGGIDLPERRSLWRDLPLEALAAALALAALMVEWMVYHRGGA